MVTALGLALLAGDHLWDRCSKWRMAMRLERSDGTVTALGRALQAAWVTMAVAALICAGTLVLWASGLLLWTLGGLALRLAAGA